MTDEVSVIKKIIKAAMMITVFAAITRGLGFVYRIFLARSIGAEGVGLYQVVLSIFMVLVTLTSSGIPVTVSRLTARAGRNNLTQEQDKTVTAAAAFGLILSTIICILILLFQKYLTFLFADNRCMPIFMALLPAFVVSSVYSAFRGGLWGKKCYFSYSLVELIEELSMVVAGILLIRGIDNVFSATMRAGVAISISYSVAGLLTVLIYLRRGGRIKPFKGYLYPIIKSSSPITGVRLASCILSSLIAIVLPARLTLYGLSPSESLAMFGIMTGMMFPLLFIPSTFTSSIALVLVPEISAKTGENCKAELSQGIFSALNFSLAIACIFYPAYLFMGAPFAQSLYNNPLVGTFLLYGAILMLPMAISQISGTVLNSLALEYKAMLHFLYGAVVMILCIWFLPRYLGIYALLIGNFINLIISASLNLKDIKKTVPISLKFFKSGLLLLAIGLLTGLIGYFVFQLLSRLCPIFWASGIGIALSISLSTLLAFVLGILDFSLFRTTKKNNE